LDIVPSSNSGARDACLLSLGFAGGLRRSELVALDVTDVVFEPAGMRLRINRSKTDQKGVGRTVGVPVGRSRFCVVQSAQTWMKKLDRQSGPLFSPVLKGGNIGSERLSPEAVASIVKRWVDRIGLDARSYSGHSLRAGFVTSAVQAGASEHSIRRQTGHASMSSMERYIRIANVFEENPCTALF
jgi:integrase